MTAFHPRDAISDRESNRQGHRHCTTGRLSHPAFQDPAFPALPYHRCAFSSAFVSALLIHGGLYCVGLGKRLEEIGSLVGGRRVGYIQDASVPSITSCTVFLTCPCRFELGLGWFWNYDGYDLAAVTLLSHGPPVSSSPCALRTIVKTAKALFTCHFLRSQTSSSYTVASNRFPYIVYSIPTPASPLTCTLCILLLRLSRGAEQ